MNQRILCNLLPFLCFSVQGEVLLRFIMSTEEKKHILHACHVDPTAGHMGKSKTLSKIKERYMWHGMVKDVLELVRRLVQSIL